MNDSPRSFWQHFRKLNVDWAMAHPATDEAIPIAVPMLQF